ncbi:tandem-95 repeat protein [Mesorhizobium sp. 8]|uniref:beta strand repeat-containing protein n=1 Tax=Mesorhizobium sp. 8 TaxID=2584466 RepID=UPI00111D20D1|nr:tandem-95 repeat protein [Mesorhizobium sp. 8]QDB99292.1 tandem-95 repeat protein [Mesorhizobium sp. 8]
MIAAVIYIIICKSRLLNVKYATKSIIGYIKWILQELQNISHPCLFQNLGQGVWAMATSFEFENNSVSWDQQENRGAHDNQPPALELAQAAAPNQLATNEPAPNSASPAVTPSEPVPVDVGTPAAQAGQHVPIASATPPAPAGHEYVAGADNVVHLPANASIDNIRVDGSNLVLQQADGSVIVIKDGAINVPSFIVGDVEVPRVALLAALESSGVNVAFGADGSISAGSAAAQHESAGGNFQQPPGGIGNGFDLSALLPPTELRFGGLDRHELYPAVANREPGIDITPNANGLAVPTGASASVAEQGLPFGSAPNENSEYSTGIFKLSDPDGLSDLKSLTIDGQTVQIGQLAGSVFAGQHGTLTILSYNEQTGIAKYQYQLTERTDDRAGPETDRFEISVSDGSTTSAPAQLIVNIVDDVPTAHAGPDLSVVETAGATAGTNLLANDVKGADGATLTGVDFNDGAGPHAIAAAGVTTLTTANGVYTFQADGTWTFDPSPNLANNGAGVDAGFTYTITDGDGDTSTAAQDVTITDGAGPTATQTPVALVVDEADLATGTTHGGANGGDPDTVAINTGGLVFTAGSDAIADVHFAAGQPAIQISGLDDAVAAQISWSGQGTDTLTGTINNVAVIRLDLTGTQTAAAGGQAVPTVTATLLAPFPHQDNPDADTLTIKGIRVEAVDSDGTVSAPAATVEVTVLDDVPHAANDAGGASENGAVVGGNVLVNDDLGADHGVVGTDGRVSGVVSGAGGAEVTNGAGLGGIAGAHGTLVLGADGSYSYTPTANASVPAGTTDVFTYTVIDKDGDTAHAELTITFSGDAFAPTAVSAAATTSDVAGDNHVAGSNADGFVAQVDTGTLAFDFGGDGPATVSPFTASYDGGLGAALSQTSVGGVTTITSAAWTLTIDETNGAYTFTQTAAYQHDLGATSDQGKVTVTLTDSDNSTKQVTLTLNITDDVPHAANDAGGASENGAVVGGNVLVNDDLGADHGVVGTDGRVSGVVSGAGGAEVTNGAGLGGIAGAHGTLVLGADGSYSYTPTANASVPAGTTDVFTYTVIDKDGDTAHAELTITFSGDAFAPTAVSAAATTSDVAGDNHVAGSNADGFVAQVDTGTLAFDFGGDGPATVSPFTASYDGGLGAALSQTSVGGVTTITSAAWTLTIDETNGAYTFTQTAAYQHDLGATSDQGKVTVTLTDSDNSTKQVTLTLNITDDVPHAANDAGGASENGAVVGGNVLVNDDLGADHGVVGTDGRVSGVVSGAGGAEVTNGAGLGGIAGAHGTLVLGADGSYSYTPTANASVPAGTTDVFTYTVIDKDGDTAHAELTITFSGDAFAPTAVSAAATTSDVAGDNHVAGSNADGFVAQVDTGTLAFDFGGDGPATVSPFTASYDGGLGAALSQTSVGGVTTITSAAWTLTIDETNGAYTFTQTAAYQHDLGATSDQGKVTVTLTDSDNSTKQVTLTLNITDDVPHAANDAGGASENGAVVGGNVLVNDDLGADHGVVGTDGRVSGVVSGAGGAEVTNGAGLGGIAGAHGTLVLGADGSYSYTPTANASVPAGTTDVFTYTVIDKDGDTAHAELTITFSGDAFAPTAVSAAATTSDVAGDNHVAGSNADGFVAQVDTGTLAFDFGGDGPATVSPFTASYDGGLGAALSQTSVGGVTTITSAAWTLTIDETNGAYTFTQTAAYQHDLGATSDQGKVTVTLTDSDNSTKQVTLTLNITDDVPHAANDAGGASENGAVVGGNVLVNDDLGADHGVVGTDGRVSGVVSGAGGAEVTNGAGLGGIAGAHGTLVLGADGSYSYTPTANASVPAGTTDVFTYTVIDKDGDTAHAELTITFSGDAFAPTAVSAAATTSDVAGDNHVAGSNADGFVAQVDTGTLAFDFGGDGPATVSPFTASYDGGLGAALSQTSVGGVTTITSAAWTLTIDETNGAYTFTQTAAYQHDLGATSDQGKVTVTLTDSDNSTKQVTLTLNITDDVPHAANDAGGASENGAVVGGNVLVNDDLGADHGVVGTDGRVTGVATGSDTSHAVSGNLGGIGIQGTCGTLVLNANGTYTYTANAVNGDQVDHFVYTVTDKDGDTSTTTLDITVKNVNSVPVGGSASAIVDDEGLPHGIFGGTGDAATNSAFATGTLTGSGGDGALSYSFANLNGATGVTIGQEKVDFTWDNSNHQLVATISTSTAGRVGQVLFTVDLDPSSGAYQVNLIKPVLHDNANNAENGDITLNLQYSVSDSDADTSAGDTGLGTLAVTFDDDSPVNFTAQSMTIENGANAIGSGALNFYESIGADGGKVAFSGGTDGVTKLTDGATTVTSGGKEVFLYGYGTDTLTGMIDLDGNGSKETTVFTVKLSPNATSEPNDIYTVQFFRTLDDGATTFITSSNLSETSARNFKMVNDPTSADKDILISASSSSGQTTVNGSNSGMIAFGAGNPFLTNTGDVLRFDFSHSVAMTGGGSGNGYTDAAHYNSNGFTFKVDGSGSSDVSVTVYQADDNSPNTYASLVNDSASKEAITQIYKNGVLVDLNDNSQVTVINGAYVVHATGGDTLSVFTDDGYNRIEVGYAGQNKFSVGNVGFVQSEAGHNLDLSFNVTATDADGDTAAGSIAVTTVPFNSVIDGTTADDLLVAGIAGQTLHGKDGNDTLIGGIGADTLDGGLGTDTASYQNSALGVTVNLTLDGTTTAQTSVGDASGDKLIGIENVIGSNSTDILTGDNNNNVLLGLNGTDTLAGNDGNDTLVGGADSDTLNGGSGTDTASYESSLAGVTVDLNLVGTAQISGGDASGDNLTAIENLIGSQFADILTGDGGNNVLAGLGGDDKLIGGAGNDTLIGGPGQDTLTGGGDADTFRLDSLDIKDLITDYSGSDAGGQGDKIDLTALFTTAAGSDISDYVQYDSTTHTLKVDANGAAGGGAGFVDVAVLQNAPASGTITILYDDATHAHLQTTI